ncbi:acyl-coenzyme A thioesterase 13 isoform X2 [Nematostella vectensis]|uniref:acyl-coenzyme A thioesterase 13 isoform X2 n=1 Tax=Nematostella vectensis TaxID=45351 RepID=UPI00138FB4E9|nr:acyl-coenzyme A thioesterase 13 isoform X2 [Nematostella vectensis]
MAALLRKGQQLWTFMTKNNPGFDRVLEKAELAAFGGGRCIIKMTVSQEHENRMGTLHGGLTATMVDDVTTMAIISQTGQAGLPEGSMPRR